MNINYVCKWSKSKEHTWSGTSFFLRESLNKIVDVVDIELHLSSVELFLINCHKLILKILGYSHFRVLDIIFLTHKANSKICDNQCNPNLMFESLITRECGNNYLFVDLSVEYLADFFNNGRDDSVKGFGRNEEVFPDELKRRLAISERFLHSCAGVFTMSKWLLDDYIQRKRINPAKVHYVGGGCNVDVTRIDKSKKNGNRFLFIGIDWERKNGNLVLESFIKLRDIYPNLELYIIGPKKQPFNGSVENVYYLGYQDYTSIVDYYNLCDFFVMPSKFEAYGLVFAEALIFGLPCIGNNCFEMPNFIIDNETGLLIKNESVNELKMCMELLYINRDRFKKNVSNNYEYYVNYYSWDSVAKRIVDVMRQDGFIK